MYNSVKKSRYNFSAISHRYWRVYTLLLRTCHKTQHFRPRGGVATRFIRGGTLRLVVTEIMNSLQSLPVKNLENQTIFSYGQ